MDNQYYQRPARSATIVSDDVTDTLESCTGSVDICPECSNEITYKKCHCKEGETL
jgi:hypothetical protein